MPAGAVIGGGTPLNDATAFAQWAAARLLVERGAVVSPWDAAALGMTDRVAAAARRRRGRLDATHCCGRPATAATSTRPCVLVDAGADVNWLGWDSLTPLGAAERAGAVDVVGWLREQARSSSRAPRCDVRRPGHRDWRVSMLSPVRLGVAGCARHTHR